MNLLTLENINKSYSEKVLLKDVNLIINEGDKIGLIGLNGAGKSTLLKIISGKEEFFTGNITTYKNIRIEYLSQGDNFKDSSTILEEIFKGDSKEMRLLYEYEKALDELNLNPENVELLNKTIITLQEEIDSLALWDIESEAKSILNKLGIKNYYEKISNLSGGQRKRVQLASALISPCDLLILDEPTNHLDSTSIEWLEEYLNARKGALLMITHDRYFLDRVTNRILELDRGILHSYIGNYTKFLEQKMERLQIEESMEEKRQSLIKKELKWVKRGAKARTTKQKARLQRFDDLVNDEYIKPMEDVEISFMGRRLGKKILELSNITKGYNDKPLISNFNYIATKEDRIGIVGDNGVGKSTLINLIKGSLSPDEGTIEKGDTIVTGCFSQDSKEMDPNLRVIDYVKEGGEVIPVADGTKITASTLCEKFLFDGTMQYTKIERLSGGERRRLQLLRILMEAPNLLLLDEPTNDLDINTLSILEDFLDTYIGVVIVVSHDRYFLDRICNKIFSFDSKSIIVNNGNYSDYILKEELKLLKDTETSINDKKATPQRVKERDLRPKFSFKEQKEYNELPSTINLLEEELEALDMEIMKNVTSYSKLQELTSKKEELEVTLMEKYERQEELEELNRKIEEYKRNNSIS